MSRYIDADMITYQNFIPVDGCCCAETEPYVTKKFIDDMPEEDLETDGMRKRMLYDTLDYQPTVIEGVVAGDEEGENLPTHKKITRIKPLAHHYMPNGAYIKYTCPVCEALGNKHQVHRGEDNCPLCNVNLIWDEE